MERTPLIAGNWKMNFDTCEAENFVNKFKENIKAVSGVDALICAPFPSLHALHMLVSGTNILLGAQNIFYEEEGTFTGEVSAKMISSYCTYVIVGHSERRAIFNESNKEVNRKIKIALEHNLVPILCFGESLEERKSGRTNKVLEETVSAGLEGISKEHIRNIVLAYEPIWAISKGKADIAKSLSATPETAQEAHSFVRSLISKLFDQETADKIRILYGGSMKPENVKQLMAKKDIDGGLVGGASLDPDSFAEVVKFKVD